MVARVRHGERKGSGVTIKEGHRRDLGGDSAVLHLAGRGGDVIHTCDEATLTYTHTVQHRFPGFDIGP